MTMIEVITQILITFSLIGVCGAIVALAMDRMDRLRVINEAHSAREELKSALEKLGATHNDLVSRHKLLQDELSRLEMRLSAVSASVSGVRPPAPNFAPGQRG